MAESLAEENARLREHVAALELRLRKDEARRRAMIHIMEDLTRTNRRLSDQRRAMLHILVDYEADRRGLEQQKERLDNSRRALLHILQDAHQTNLKLGESRKAMIHIMGDLRETTDEMRAREQELRDKQEQLVQAAKLATLGELTTGVAHELNNPLNNIGLFLGNISDQLELGTADRQQIEEDLTKAMRQVSKATEIITHLRAFGRVALVAREEVSVNDVIQEALSLVREQLRLRQIETDIELSDADPIVLGNAIQLEQVCLNLLTNARDAVAGSPTKIIRVSTSVEEDGAVRVCFEDSGPGIPAGMEQRIFDPFFTTKEVGHGTGLGLSITYGIVQEHGGEISVANAPGGGARFIISLPGYAETRGAVLI
ncbi:MAG TPA: ATP-binding protein [Tepidiformaceae bacterium]|nr:ATP-binding protein [Tepidiformaceae bacterium]